MFISPVARSIPFDNENTPFSSENVRDAIIESYNSLEARLIYPFICGANGTVSDKYLNGFFSISTEEVPMIVPIATELLYLSLSNAKNIGSATVHVYKIDADLTNQAVLQTFSSITGYTYKSALQVGKTLGAGQGLQVRVESVSGTKPSDPMVILFLRAL